MPQGEKTRALTPRRHRPGAGKHYLEIRTRTTASQVTAMPIEQAGMQLAHRTGLQLPQHSHCGPAAAATTTSCSSSSTSTRASSTAAAVGAHGLEPAEGLLAQEAAAPRACKGEMIQILVESLVKVRGHPGRERRCGGGARKRGGMKGGGVCQKGRGAKG